MLFYYVVINKCTGLVLSSFKWAFVVGASVTQAWRWLATILQPLVARKKMCFPQPVASSCRQSQRAMQCCTKNLTSSLPWSPLLGCKDLQTSRWAVMKLWKVRRKLESVAIWFHLMLWPNLFWHLSHSSTIPILESLSDCTHKHF